MRCFIVSFNTHLCIAIDATTSMFGSMVVIAFQITFHAKIHVSDVFLFFKKIIFNISTSKRFKTYKTY
jgi:hypothetical protein